MNEVKIEIQQKGNYNNIFPKKQLNAEEYITVVKSVYAEGLEKEGQYGKYYIGTVDYDGVTVSFFMNPKEHEAFRVAGGIGDKLRIFVKEEQVVNTKTNTKMLIPRMGFEKVE